MQPAYLVVGRVSVFNREAFLAKTDPKDWEENLRAAPDCDKDLGFQMCFETDNILQARRWAVLSSMEVGSRVIRISGVYRAMAKSGNRYVFLVGNVFVGCAPADPPKPISLEEQEDE